MSELRSQNNHITVSAAGQLKSWGTECLQLSGTLQEMKLFMFFNFIQKNVHLSIMAEYEDIKKHEITLKNLQFTILMISESRYAIPHTTLYAASSFMKLAFFFFSKTEVHFGSKLLSWKLILLSVKLIAMLWSPLIERDQALTEQQTYWTIGKQYHNKNVVAI